MLHSCMLFSSYLIRCSAKTKEVPHTILKWMWYNYDSGIYALVLTHICTTRHTCSYTFAIPDMHIYMHTQHAHTTTHSAHMQHTVLHNPLLLQVDISPYPGMHKCCDKHDKCYDTCNTEKAECDNDFQSCMAEYCTTLKPRRLERDCGNAAGLMFTGTAVFGCDSYLESQKQACDCSHIPKTSGRLRRDTKEGL